MKDETMNTEIKIAEVDTSVVYEGDKANIDAQVSTARQYPRNTERAVQNAIAIATMDEETAASCNYSVPRGGKAITGPSIHLAKIIAQTWGNLRASARVVRVEDRNVVSEAVCWDLESNTAIQVSVKRRITDRKGKRFGDDMITVTGNAANSIALRNAILAVVPKAVSNTVYKKALAKITGDLTSEDKLIKRRKVVVEKLMNTYNVTEEEVLSSIGRRAMSHVTANDIVTLIGIGQAIKDGDATVEGSFKKTMTAGAEDPRKVAEKKEAERMQMHLSSLADQEAYEFIEHIKKKDLKPAVLEVIEEREKQIAEHAEEYKKSKAKKK
jgi:hypothetical protein